MSAAAAYAQQQAQAAYETRYGRSVKAPVWYDDREARPVDDEDEVDGPPADGASMSEGDSDKSVTDEGSSSGEDTYDDGEGFVVPDGQDDSSYTDEGSSSGGSEDDDQSSSGSSEDAPAAAPAPVEAQHESYSSSDEGSADALSGDDSGDSSE